jgi:hypothetical protein
MTAKELIEHLKAIDDDYVVVVRIYENDIFFVKPLDDIEISIKAKTIVLTSGENT